MHLRSGRVVSLCMHTINREPTSLESLAKVVQELSVQVTQTNAQLAQTNACFDSIEDSLHRVVDASDGKASQIGGDHFDHHACYPITHVMGNPYITL